MADLDTIVQAIVTLLIAIDGIGKVLDYSRYTASEKEKIDTYAFNGLLNCWIVTRESTKAYDRGAGATNVRSQHKIVIVGFRAITAGATSEHDHQMLAETVRSTLHAN